MGRIGSLIVWLAVAPAVAALGLAPGGAQELQSSPPPSAAPSSSATPSAATPSLSTPGELGKVIAELNSASAKFKSAQADFNWDQFQAVVQEDEIQTGTIYFERRKDETLVAAQIKQVDGQDEPKFVVYRGGQIQFYQPAIKQMTILRAGANPSQTESFLTLGFGGSGTDLEASWNVTLVGNETMGGVPVVELNLKPKAQNVQNLFTHVTVWIDPTRGISLKQIFYEPSGDRRTTTYTNVKYNQPIPDDVFRIKTAPGTEVQTK